MRELLLRARIAPRALILRRVVRSPTLARGYARLPKRLQRGGWWVTRHADVVDVLGRDQDFGMPYLQRMEELGTSFVLGLDPSPRYDRQVAAIRTALAEVDVGRLGEMTRERAEQVLARRPTGVDLLTLTNDVLAHTVGAELWGGRALSDKQLGEARAIARDIFINPLEDPAVRRRAMVALPVLRRYVKTIVDDRRRLGPGRRPDALDRLLEAEGDAFEGDEVTDALLGIVIAWVTAVPRALGFAFEELLRKERRAALERAQAAANGGSVSGVGDVLLEVLRFRPSMPALERVCTRRTRLAGTEVPRGQKVLLVLTTAMLDAHGLPEPREVRPGRPDGQYLHFGRGAHACLGQAIAREQMQQIAAALLRRPKVAARGSMKTEGPYPARLLVDFDVRPVP